MRILLTRPHDDAAPLTEKLQSRGHDVISEPMLEIRFAVDAAVDLSGVQAILFTSANGVRAFATAEPRRDLPVYAVGDATAAAALAAGFARVESAGGNVDDLARLVRERLKPQDGILFHAAARDLAGDLAGALTGAGFELRRAVLYTAEPVTALSPATAAALKAHQVDLVLFFSARTAETFARLVERAGLASALSKCVALGLSPAALEPVKALPWAMMEAARRPGEADVIQAIARQKIIRQLAGDVAGTEPDPEVKFGRRAEDPSAPPAPAGRARGRFLTAMVWIAMLLALGTFVLQLLEQGRPLPDMGAATALRLETRLTALEHRIDGLKPLGSAASDPQVEAKLRELNDRVAALETQQAPAPSPSAAEDEAKLSALETRVQALEGGAASQKDSAPAASVDALAARVDALEKSLATRPDTGQLASLMAENRRLAGELARIQEQVTTLDASEGERGRAGLLLAVGQLAAAAKRGGSVAPELATVRALAADDSRLVAALAELQPIVGRSVPTFEALLERFPAVAKAAIHATQPDTTEAKDSTAGTALLAAWWSRLVGRLSQVVTIRRVGDVPGDYAAARLARAEQRLDARDLAGAVDQLGGLQGPSADAVAAWLADARMRVVLDHAVDDLSAAAVAATGSGAAGAGK